MGSSSSSQYAFSHLETGKSNELLSNCVRKCHRGKKILLGGRKMVLSSTCPKTTRTFCLPSKL